METRSGNEATYSTERFPLLFVLPVLPREDCGTP